MIIFVARTFLLLGAFAVCSKALAGETNSLSSAVNSISPSNLVSVAETPSKQPGDTKSKMTISDWASWIQAVTSVVNLVIVVWLFIWTDRSHKKERLDDFADRELERKARVAGFWVEELIMRPHHPLLQKFFQDIEARLKNPNNGPVKETGEALLQAASHEIEQFKEQYHEVRSKVVEPLQCVHGDFGKLLLPILENIEDLVTAEMIRIPGAAKPGNGSCKKTCSDRLAELRREFYEAIHKIQTKVVLISPRKRS